MALCVTPTTSPTFVPSHLVESSPASSIANFADARQYFDTLAALLNRLSGKTASKSKSLISPPRRLFLFFVSKHLISFIPALQFMRLSQNASFPIPAGLTTPIPVITNSSDIKRRLEKLLRHLRRQNQMSLKQPSLLMQAVLIYQRYSEGSQGQGFGNLY